MDYDPENVYLLCQTHRDRNWQFEFLLYFLPLEERQCPWSITLDIDRSSMSTNATGCVGQERSVRWSTSCNFLLIHEFLNDIR